jgi:bifunctional non-homologous end joining protein LigD
MATRRTDGFIEPCIPTLAAKPPSDPGWVHEIEHDGYRLIVRRDGDAVRLFTRRGHDWTERYPEIARAAAKLRAKSFTLDGEAVVCGPDGVAMFDALHRRGTVAEAMLYAFDLLELDGADLRALPLGERKTKLAKLLARAPAALIFNEHTEENGATVFRHARKMGLEGIVSKRLSAPYRSGPSRDWIKVKNPDSPAMVRHARGATEVKSAEESPRAAEVKAAEVKTAKEAPRAAEVKAAEDPRRAAKVTIAEANVAEDALCAEVKVTGDARHVAEVKAAADARCAAEGRPSRKRPARRRSQSHRGRAPRRRDAEVKAAQDAPQLPP